MNQLRSSFSYMHAHVNQHLNLATLSSVCRPVHVAVSDARKP